MSNSRYEVWWQGHPIAWFISYGDANQFINSQHTPFEYEIKNVI